MENSGIPLWFRCFKGIDDPDAFNLSLIAEGISYVNNLFKDKKCQLIFLADRWFNFREIMEHIQSLGNIYLILNLFPLNLYILIALESLASNFKLSWLLVNLILTKNLTLFLLMAILEKLLNIMATDLVLLNLSLKIKNLMAFIWKALKCVIFTLLLLYLLLSVLLFFGLLF